MVINILELFERGAVCPVIRGLAKTVYILHFFNDVIDRIIGIHSIIVDITLQSCTFDDLYTVVDNAHGIVDDRTINRTCDSIVHGSL